ncbi:jg601, partial [Pararge aegeria aegeria]
MKGDSAL